MKPIETISSKKIKNIKVMRPAIMTNHTEILRAPQAEQQAYIVIVYPLKIRLQL